MKQSVILSFCVALSILPLGCSHEKTNAKAPDYKEGVDYEIVPDSVPIDMGRHKGEYYHPSNAGDTIWLRGPKSTRGRGSSGQYESDPTWREVQRHVDNDPYFKQW